MRILWAAEARKERTTGQVLGTQERIPREELLRGFTSRAAYLSFEEEQKGSLVAGRLADLIILSANPLKVSTEELKNIEGAVDHGWREDRPSKSRDVSRGNLRAVE